MIIFILGWVLILSSKGNDKMEDNPWKIPFRYWTGIQHRKFLEDEDKKFKSRNPSMMYLGTLVTKEKL